MFCWNLCYHFNALVNNSINFSCLMLGLSRWVWWVLSSEALITAKKSYDNFLATSFTRLLTLLCLIACLYTANLTLQMCFLACQTTNDSKGGFPPSCYFYVRTQVNFTRVNNIEPMYGRSRVNVKFELRSTLFKRGCVTAVQFILFNFVNYSPSIAMELKVSKEITGKWQNQSSETNK